MHLHDIYIYYGVLMYGHLLSLILKEGKGYISDTMRTSFAVTMHVHYTSDQTLTNTVTIHISQFMNKKQI